MLVHVYFAEYLRAYKDDEDDEPIRVMSEESPLASSDALESVLQDQLKKSLQVFARRHLLIVLKLLRKRLMSPEFHGQRLRNG